MRPTARPTTATTTSWTRPPPLPVPRPPSSVCRRHQQQPWTWPLRTAWTLWSEESSDSPPPSPQPLLFPHPGCAAEPAFTGVKATDRRVSPYVYWASSSKMESSNIFLTARFLKSLPLLQTTPNQKNVTSSIRARCFYKRKNANFRNGRPIQKGIEKGKRGNDK